MNGLYVSSFRYRTCAKILNFAKDLKDADQNFTLMLN